MKAWREWARRRGKRHRLADALFYRSARERGFGRWRSWYVEHNRLRKWGGIIKKRRVGRVLRDCFVEWHRKCIVNRKLLRRVFTIGIEVNEKGRSDEQSEYCAFSARRFAPHAVLTFLLRRSSRSTSRGCAATERRASSTC